MAKPPSETRQRIQDVARELFTQKGMQRTSLQDIADRLGITLGTVKSHVEAVLGKTGASGRVQAALLAHRSGLIR